MGAFLLHCMSPVLTRSGPGCRVGSKPAGRIALHHIFHDNVLSWVVRLPHLHPARQSMELIHGFDPWI